MESLTASKYVGIVHDSVMEADARQDVLSGAAVVVQVELVVLLGHVYAVAVMNGGNQGSRDLYDSKDRASIDMNVGTRD